MFFDIVDEEDLYRRDGRPFHGFQKDLNSRLLETHLMRQDPLVKEIKDGKGRKGILKMEGIRVG